MKKENSNSIRGERKFPDTVWGIMRRSVVQIVRRPIMWVGFFMLPLFMFLFFSTLLSAGLPTRIPAAIVDKDGTALSRNIGQTLNSMQMVDLRESLNSYTEAREEVQKGNIYGFFMIPENFEADLLAGRKPVITFYTNMVYYVPANLLYKYFKTTAVFTKVGVAASVVQTAGVNPADIAGMIQAVNIQTRGIGNPSLNYGIYLCNSFIPAVLQLMIMLITVFSLGQEVKYHTSVRLMKMARGSIARALFGKLFPQTVIWWVIAFFMTAWLFRYNHFPMNGSWFWLGLSEMLFVVASQAFALVVYCILPNLRLSLSVCALLGILTFSIAAYSFPEQSMYGGVAIFTFLMPARYNFLIYGNIALNGLPVYYSRIWFAAYFIYLLLPLPLLGRARKAMLKPVYCP